MSTYPMAKVRRSFEIGSLQIGIILLTLVTALIHIQVSLAMSGGPRRPSGGAPDGGFSVTDLLPFPMPTMFLLNAVGYLVLVLALYLPALEPYRRITRWLLIVFTAVTVVLYFMIVGLRPNVIGLVDKVVEMALIVLLLVEDRGEKPTPARIGAQAPVPH